MYLKALAAIATFSITIAAAFAENEPTSHAPKPTLADVQHLANAISGDKSKLRAYCELPQIHDRIQQALGKMDGKAVDELIAETDALEQRLGSEYDKIVDGLDQIDLNSAEGQEIADVFKTLQEHCE